MRGCPVTDIPSIELISGNLSLSDLLHKKRFPLSSWEICRKTFPKRTLLKLLSVVDDLKDKPFEQNLRGCFQHLAELS